MWEDDLDLVGSPPTVRVLREGWQGSSPGYNERRKHVELLSNGQAEGFGVVCTAVPGTLTGARKIKDFECDSLLRFHRIEKVGDDYYAVIKDRVLTKDLARSRTASSSLVSDLASLRSARGDITQRESLINARVGQGYFRAGVLDRWKQRCCVTDTAVPYVIRASHIKPWRDSNNSERLDPDNGLPLVATLDALFDAGLITFSQTGELLISSRLDAAERDRLALVGMRLLQEPCEKTQTYLSYHREKVFA